MLIDLRNKVKKTFYVLVVGGFLMGSTVCLSAQVIGRDHAFNHFMGGMALSTIFAYKGMDDMYMTDFYL